jgi:hypothetical protein
MLEVENIRDTIDSIYENNSMLDTLIDFEGVLDSLHLYAYKNWNLGEVVQGPEVSRYWVEVTLMYPESSMPDPEGSLRLTKHGCYVSFKKDEYIEPVRVRSKDDVVDAEEDGQRHHGLDKKPRAKKVSHPVWLVRISVPRNFLDDLNNDHVEVNGVDVDMAAVDAAYQAGLDQATKGENIAADADEEAADDEI